jgi:two-component system CheB/CheR fusion protein
LKSTIIGAGASAGGLEAISELLSGLSARPGAALIVVQHLDRSHDSLLTEILGRRTSMPVVAAADGVAVQADRVYVIPPNVTLTVAGGVLCLAPRAAGREVHKPVDALLRSLAEDCGERAVGVILSGADSDGAAGIEAIKQAGGITFAQSPESARVPSMPQSAIATGCVDFVMPPVEIGRELRRLATHPYLQSAQGGTDAANSRDGEAEASSEADEADALRRVFRRLRTLHGVDFGRYKSRTLRRRLARRMALHRFDHLSQYVELLEHDVAETAALYQDFLIRVTSFFRDPESFQVLSERIAPSLLANRAAREPVRIWVPGCASGEEVYSIAITLLESIGESTPPAGIQIFGTDVSETAIEKCRAGLYPDSIAQDVPPELLRRYFVKQDSHYLICRSVRDLCVFARHDITRDPPYSRLDLVSCRNLLIYLGAAAQARVMQVFRYALRSTGFLLLGPSESVGHGEDLFEPLDREHRVYRPKATAPGMGPSSMRERERLVPAPSSPGDNESADRDFIESETSQRQADRLLLARYAPAGMLVDEALNILQFRGQVAPYLAPASGPPSLNLMRIVRPELLLAIPPAVQEARTGGRAVRRSGVIMEGIGEVSLEVIPLAQSGGVTCFLILLEDESSRRISRRESRPQSPLLSESEKDRRVDQLERENVELREFLQATMEQHEAAKEELKSAHEEVLSANEEFQSTNEELETSKEELQSANEELITTNEELRERNRLLGALNGELEKARSTSERARAYADGIVETVHEPLAVLDDALKVVRVNHAFCAEFHTAPGHVEGRSLHEVAAVLGEQSLREQLVAVLAQSSTLIDYEVTLGLPEGGERVLRLNARKIVGDADRGALILLAIEDVTENRKRTDVLRRDSRRKDEFLAMLAHELRNPLGAITHAVHLLKQGSSDAAPRLHDMMERQTIRLVRLVNDLLDVARVSRGLIELQRETLDLIPVVLLSVDAARERAEQRRHVLTVSVPDGPVCVEGDRVRLEQVVANLLENAIKYTEPGGRIDVKVSEDGSDAVLRVADNGIGLAPESLEQVFEVFTQVNSSLARSSEGLGLGLTVVRRVLELHGGRIEALSAGLGQGSEFVVRLPLKPSALIRSQPGAELEQLALDVQHRRRILIVDDNVDSGEAMSIIFELWGHEVRTSESGAGALALLEHFTPDVAFVDIGLPDIDGYELASRLREKNELRSLRLIALTGYGTAADRQRARAAGFDHHVVKPAEPHRLAELLA